MWTFAHQPPRIVQKLNYRRDRQGYVEDGSTHIFVLSADGGGTPRQVTSGNFNDGAFRWMPDGKRIVFSGLRVPDAEYAWRESEIYSVDLSSGDVAQLTHRKGPDFGPVVSPDGKLVAYLGYDWTDDTYITNKLYLMLKANDRVGLAQHLRDREQGGVKARGLAHLWEPTPFPFELQAAHR